MSWRSGASEITAFDKPKDRRGRSVIAFELDDGRAGEPVRELQDVAHRRGAEPVDRLRVVADDRQVAVGPERSHRREDVGLDRVRVLVLVHEDVVEHPRELRPGNRRRRECFPEQEQVVVVEGLLRALTFDVRPEDQADPVHVVDAPRVPTLDDVVQPDPGVDDAGMDRGQRVLPREAPASRREPELLPKEVHHVCPVGLVEDGEGRGEAERAAVDPQEAIRDRVERPAPHAPGVGAAGHPLRAGQELFRGAAAVREEQDPFRRDRAFGDEPGHARGERRRLARAGPRHDQQGPLAVGGRRPLLGVELIRVEHVFEEYRSEGVPEGRTPSGRAEGAGGRRPVEAELFRAPEVGGGRPRQGVVGRGRALGQRVRDERPRPAAPDDPAVVLESSVRASDGVRGQIQLVPRASERSGGDRPAGANHVRSAPGPVGAPAGTAGRRHRGS